MGTDNPRRRAAIHQTGDRKKHAPLPSSAFMIEPESTTVTVAEVRRLCPALGAIVGVSSFGIYRSSTA
jgi:hypothetical protein